MRLITFVIALSVGLFAASGALQREDLTSPEWKDEIARGYLPYRQLTAEDFPVNDRVVSPYKMHTEGFIHYTFRTTATGGTARVTDFKVRSGFDRNKSWRRSTANPDANLLAHEQGHLDICEWYAAQFMKIKLPAGIGLDGRAATDQIREKLRELFGQVLAENQAEQDLYDLETRHGAEQESQTAWTDRLQRRLRDLKRGD